MGVWTRGRIHTHETLCGRKTNDLSPARSGSEVRTVHADELKLLEKDFLREWLHHELVDTSHEGSCHLSRLGLCCDHHQFHVPEAIVRSDELDELKAVHHRHVPVYEGHLNVTNVRLHMVESLLTIPGLQNTETKWFHNLTEDTAHGS